MQKQAWLFLWKTDKNLRIISLSVSQFFPFLVIRPDNADPGLPRQHTARHQCFQTKPSAQPHFHQSQNLPCRSEKPEDKAICGSFCSSGRAGPVTQESGHGRKSEQGYTGRKCCQRQQRYGKRITKYCPDCGRWSGAGSARSGPAMRSGRSMVQDSCFLGLTDPVFGPACAFRTAASPEIPCRAGCCPQPV